MRRPRLTRVIGGHRGPGSRRRSTRVTGRASKLTGGDGQAGERHGSAPEVTGLAGGHRKLPGAIPPWSIVGGVTDPLVRRAEATHAIDSVLREYRDVFGPDHEDSGIEPFEIPDGDLLLGDWIVVFTSVDTDNNPWVTTVTGSQTSGPTAVGLLQIAQAGMIH